MLENNKNGLSDPLTDNEVLPEFAAKLKINHWSPTQGSMIDAAWIFRYLVLDQVQRRQLPANAQMKAGVFSGDAVQNYFADEIYKIGPSKKIEAHTNFKKGRDKNDLVIEAVNQMKDYQAVDAKDEDKKQKYIDEIVDVTHNAYKAAEELLKEFGSVGDTSVVAEQQISLSQRKTSLLLPLVGRTDIAVFKKGSDIPLLIGEMKTQWSKLGKVKKNGERSYISVSSPTLPNFSHLMQCAYYSSVYDFKAPVKLFYVNKNDYKIFDSSNCEHLTVEGMKQLLEQLLNVFRRREKLLSMFQELERASIITNMIDCTEMNRDHPFYWSNLGDENLKLAETLWKLK